MRWCYPVPLLLFMLFAAGCTVGPDDWRAELRDLHGQLAEHHVDLYHSVSKEELARAVADLDRRIPTLTTPEILVGVAQILAMVGDGHTDRVHLERAFSRLPPRSRQLLWLAYVNEFTHQEIAEMLGVVSTSVRVLLSRARKKFREGLRQRSDS